MHLYILYHLYLSEFDSCLCLLLYFSLPQILAQLFVALCAFIIQIIAEIRMCYLSFFKHILVTSQLYAFFWHTFLANSRNTCKTFATLRLLWFPTPSLYLSFSIPLSLSSSLYLSRTRISTFHNCYTHLFNMPCLKFCAAGAFPTVGFLTCA